MPAHYEWNKTRLYIDAGHGLGNVKADVFDTGAVSPDGKAREADLTLTFALTLKFFCVKFGLPFVCSRTDNKTSKTLAERVAEARETRCSHYLAIHCNESEGTKASGTETFMPDKVPGQPVSSHVRQWPLILHSFVVKGMNLPDRGVKFESDSARRRLAVMRFADETLGRCSALVEVGFLTSPEDLEAMRSVQTRIGFAHGVLMSLAVSEGMKFGKPDPFDPAAPGA